MSDAAPTKDFSSTADDELVFDDLAFGAAPVVTAPSAEARAVKPRRAPRRGSKSVEGASSPEPDPASSVTMPSAEAMPAAAEEPVSTPAPFPPLRDNLAGSKTSPLLLVVIGFALLTSTVSLGGLIAVGRTLAHADTYHMQANAEYTALASVPTLVAHLDEISTKLDVAAARITPVGTAIPATSARPRFAERSTTDEAGPAITLADLHHELDGLKMSLNQRQPDGLASLNGVAQNGFSELATRLDRLSRQIDQMQMRSGAPSAGRQRSRSDG